MEGKDFVIIGLIAAIVVLVFVVGLSINLSNQNANNNISQVANVSNTTPNNTTQAEDNSVKQVSTEKEKPKAYAYKSDGTPMYSQSEVDRYVSNKYGSVDGYHIQDNGYVNLDDSRYTDDGHVRRR